MTTILRRRGPVGGGTGVGRMSLARTWAWFLAVLAMTALLPLPAQAATAAQGIADSEASTFMSPLWPGLNVRFVRGIAPYDIALLGDKDPNHPRVRSFEGWLNAAKASRQSVGRPVALNVGLERITDPERAGYGSAPDEATYKRAFLRFRDKYIRGAPYRGLVTVVGPWNEPNYKPDGPGRGGSGSRARLPGGRYFLDDPDGGCDEAQPRARHCGPRMAAYYWRWARRICPECTLAAGEFAGTRSSKYIQRYKHHLGAHGPKGNVKLWSVHNIADVIRYQVEGDHDAAELKNFLDEIYCRGKEGVQNDCTGSTKWASGNMWIGSTSPYYSLACTQDRMQRGKCKPGDKTLPGIGEDSQCRAAAFINRFANLDPRITRTYIYTFADPGGEDSGIVDPSGTRARKAYAVVRDRAQACRR